MQILDVELSNFKCFREASFKLSKITILTGANSSGKSSFLYSLLAILQSEKFPFYLSPNGAYVDLGSFKEISYGNIQKNPIEISFKLANPKSKLKCKTLWTENRRNKLPKLEELTIESKNLNIRISKVKLGYNLFYENKNYNPYIVGKVKNEILKIQEIKAAQSFSFKKNLVKIENAEFDSMESIFEKLFFNKKIHYLSSIFEGFEESLKDFSSFSNFIGSFREPPQRTYYQKSKSKDKVDISGQGYIDQILEWEETKSQNFIYLNKLLFEIGLFSKIRSKKIVGGRFELLVKVNEGGRYSSITDVGFGISQFLPIIVADLQLPKNSLLMMSQPEIHLHPKVQATLGDYFVKQIKQKKKQYIVETHSEYLLNRLRLNVVNGEISEEDIAVYYLTNTKTGTVIHPITFSKTGEILGAPKDFFDTYMVDVMNIALNA